MRRTRRVVLIVGGRVQDMTPEEEAALTAEHRAEAEADRVHDAEVAARARARPKETVASAARTVPRSRGARTGTAKSTSSTTAGSDDDGEPEAGVTAPAVANAIRQVATSELRLHQSAGIVPEASPAEYQALLADIEKEGVLEPLAVRGIVVLDGRHRLRAALELGLQFVPVRQVSGDKPDEVVLLATALHRRHLSDDQRAVMAARWVEKGGAL